MAEQDTDAPDIGVEGLLEHLKRSRAFDFTGYKRTTLKRRIDKRMQEIGIERYDEYLDRLEVDPSEFEALFNTILINVTAFFRDPEAWEALRSTAVADIVAKKEPDEPIRVWSAGCASGMEAYSAVILFAEAMGVSSTKERLKVYATDVDAEALDEARQAVFRDKDLEGVPDALRDRYFERTNGGTTYVFKNDLRRCVIFGRHDLLQDAPISRVDLLLCRNTLMYFNADVQLQLVNRLHFALAEGGYLFLGRVEMLLGQGELFDAVDVKQRIFRQQPRTSMRARLLVMASSSANSYAAVGEERLVDLALELSDQASVVIDAFGNIALANARARSMFGIPVPSLGRPFQDIELSYRPVELRSWIDQARTERRPLALRGIERWTSNGDLTYLDIDIVPLVDESDQLVGVLLAFNDVTPHHQLQEELEHTHRELETAYEELQSTNEELETTNEELQSTIEELETTNEELQSTNEELETMNEELSSTNEELQTINDELRDRTGDLNQVNAFMESILVSMRAGVIVTDRDLRIQVWNGLSQEQWGLRADETEGRTLVSLDVGLPVVELTEPLRRCLSGESEHEQLHVDAVSRRGRKMRTRVRISPLRGQEGEVEGVIVLTDDGEDDADSS